MILRLVTQPTKESSSIGTADWRKQVERKLPAGFADEDGPGGRELSAEMPLDNGSLTFFGGDEKVGASEGHRGKNVS